MTIELDHFIVSARDQRASAKLLAELLGVRLAAPEDQVEQPGFRDDDDLLMAAKGLSSADTLFVIVQAADRFG